MRKLMGEGQFRLPDPQGGNRVLRRTLTFVLVLGIDFWSFDLLDDQCGRSLGTVGQLPHG